MPMPNTPIRISATPATTWSLANSMMAAGSQTKAVPTAGTMLSSAITVPQSTGAPTPSIANAMPPMAPCAAPTTNVPLIVARDTSRESVEQIALALVAERQRAHQAVEQLLPVAQEEEQQIQHQEEEHEHANGVLADRERARCDELADIDCGARELRLEAARVDAEPLEQFAELRHVRDGARVQVLEAELSAFRAVHRAALPRS